MVIIPAKAGIQVPQANHYASNMVSFLQAKCVGNLSEKNKKDSGQDGMTTFAYIRPIRKFFY